MGTIDQKFPLRRLQQSACPECAVWGCIFVLMGHTSRQMGCAGVLAMLRCSVMLRQLDTPTCINSTRKIPSVSYNAAVIDFRQTGIPNCLAVGQIWCFCCISVCFYAFRKIAKSDCALYIRPFVRPRGTTRLPSDGL